jgi:hypothetical protein
VTDITFHIIRKVDVVREVNGLIIGVIYLQLTILVAVCGPLGSLVIDPTVLHQVAMTTTQSDNVDRLIGSMTDIIAKILFPNNCAYFYLTRSRGSCCRIPHINLPWIVT